jgi:digeranylgeranylglycerophospholipid reductase
VYDTIIVGAGPVGSYLAHKLAQRGYKVLVMEQKGTVEQDICCTGIVSKACYDLLGIDDDLVLHKAKSARFFNSDGESLRLWRDHDVAYAIDRPALNTVLVQRAQLTSAEYVFSTRATDIENRGDCIQVKATNSQKDISLEAKTAVIATGFGSALPEKLNLGKIDKFTIGAQAKVTINDINEVEIYFDQTMTRGWFAWLVPATNGKGLAGLMARRQTKQCLDKFLSTLIAQHKIQSTDVRIAYEAIPLRSLPKTYADRVLVVGEAAGQVKPTTGGGIYFGLLGANIAADTLHQALLNNDFSSKRLASYQDIWHRLLKRELIIGSWAQQ